MFGSWQCVSSVCLWQTHTHLCPLPSTVLCVWFRPRWRVLYCLSSLSTQSGAGQGTLWSFLSLAVHYIFYCLCLGSRDHERVENIQNGVMVASSLHYVHCNCTFLFFSPSSSSGAQQQSFQHRTEHAATWLTGKSCNLMPSRSNAGVNQQVSLSGTIMVPD